MHTGESGDVPQYMSYLGVAQLAERVPWEHEAVGSNPTTQTIIGGKRYDVENQTPVLGSS